jgi:hypothetical protein
MEFKKIFEEDLKILNQKLLNKEKFSFSKYADGEHQILLNKQIKNCDDWNFNPNSDNEFHKMLLESLKFKDNGYYIGISCPCCDLMGYNWYVTEKGSDENHTTFANLFVNSNYEYFKSNLLPTFNTYDRIFLIANQNSNLNRLKSVLNFTDFYGIGPEAFKTDLSLIEKLKTIIKEDEIKNSLFLFCAGPLGNVLSHQLWDFNKDNTYLDIGSTLNVWTEKNIRDYQTPNGVYTKRTCNF